MTKERVNLSTFYREYLTTKSRIGKSKITTVTPDSAKNVNVDLSLSDLFISTLPAGGPFMLNVSNASTDKTYSQSFVLHLKSTDGATPFTWPANIKWNFGTAPKLSIEPGCTDAFRFDSYDGGVTWIGSTILSNVK